MIKKFFLGLMAAAMLITTSCQKQEFAPGQDATVTFEVATPEIATRAYSDGQTATRLQYAVYDAKGNYLETLTRTNEKINGSATVQLQLTTGNTYSIVFWAAAPNAPYILNFGEKKMTVDYEGAVCNDESRDAFYCWYTFTVSGTTEKVQLKRPFAQLNIGTADYTASDNAGYVPTQSSVTVKNIYSTLNFDGSVANPVAGKFDYADIDRTETFPVAGCEYLAMNYLLVAKDKETVEVEFNFTDGSNVKNRKVGAVPVQRNYRTNIYGNLMTSDVDINVEIKPEYNEDPSYENFVLDVHGLQQALNNAPVDKTTTIYLGADIKGDVIEYQKADRNIIIDGKNHKYDGTIKIHNGSNYNNGSIIIKNVNFETATPALNFIMPNEFGVENGVTRRYSNNVIVEGCTFTATGDAEYTAVGVQAKATKNLQVLNCTANGLHSLVQAQSCDEDVVVENANIVGKNGIAFKQVRNVVVSGVVIKSAAYGIRFDGNTDNYGITVKNVNVDAVQPFIVRKMTGKNNVIALEGTNTLTTAEPYQIVITNGSDDEAYSFPEGTFKMTGADDFTVYPVAVSAASKDSFNESLSTDDVWQVTLGTDIEYLETEAVVIEKDFTIVGNDYKIQAGGASSLTPSVAVMGDYDAVLDNVDVEGGFVGAYYGANVDFNGGSLKFTDGMSGRQCFYAASTNDKQSVITITDVDVNMANASGNSYLCAHGNAVIYVKGGNFYGKPVGSSNPYVKEVALGSYTGEVIITGGTFNFNPSEYVPDGYEAIQSGDTWTVSAK